MAHGQTENLQAVDEFLPTVEGFLEKNPQYIEANGLGVLIEPERIFQFRVPRQDDQGNWHVNRGNPVQKNSAIGPYNGGI
ncbi:Glu/Leu/Phe/Val dehydrogenase dimerization domain-containing protein, partial [Enterococcus faecalis]|uniref:Glu/Leu/Phe/Val dehydrogenase dimerization domain-containing protein n=1 Tax=Enterococcus faecalis TaxID=1351 RepID=UPI003CC57DCD